MTNGLINNFKLNIFSVIKRSLRNLVAQLTKPKAFYADYFNYYHIVQSANKPRYKADN